METKYVKEIHSKGFKVYIIDDYELGCPKRTGTYVIHEAGDITLIDTCTSPSIRYILAGLNELKVELTQVKNIIVTHIHIDHAGAAGLLMKCCPNAKLFVHPEGTKFLCEPHKLEESLKIGFGNDIFNNQFAPLIKGTMSGMFAFLSGMAGAILGITLSYILGLKLGLPILNKYGSKIHIKENQIEKTHVLFEKYAPFLLIIGYFSLSVKKFLQ